MDRIRLGSFMRGLQWSTLPLCSLALAFAVSGVVSPAAATTAAQRGQRGGRAGRGRAGDAALKHEVSNAQRKQAVCSDGSSPVFYFQPGQGAARQKWIIFLQGGGGCVTDAACTSRWNDQHNLVTASGRPARVEFNGILSSDTGDNPDFHDFSRVLVHYCSSDAYAGDGQRGIGGRTFQFRGHRIVDAVLDDLMDKSVVGSSTLREATDVIVAGSSAGGFGVHNNVDHVAERLSWAHVKGIADSGWVPQGVTSLGPGTIDVRPDDPRALGPWHAHPDGCVRRGQSRERGEVPRRVVRLSVSRDADVRVQSISGTSFTSGRSASRRGGRRRPNAPGC